MKITMIGTSGSGKTVFSAGVYSVFMRKEFEGFSVYPRGDGLPSQLIEAHRFTRDYKSLANKRWPDGTKEFNLFPFDLYYQGRKITKFDWIDYRGGVLDDPNIDAEMASDIYAHIAASDAVILFADAHKLTETYDPDEAAFLSGADAVCQIISGFAKNYPGNKLSFLIALTKCDAISKEWKGKDNSYSPLIEHGIKAFHPLGNIYKRERLWRGGIIPVSTMGEGTVNSNGDIVGFLKPLNIGHVMAFCVSSTLRHEQDDRLQTLINRGGRIDQIESQYKGFLGAIRRTFHFFNKANNDLGVLEEMRKEQMNDLAELNKIRRPVEALETIALQKVRIIT